MRSSAIPQFSALSRFFGLLLAVVAVVAPSVNAQETAWAFVQPIGQGASWTPTTAYQHSTIGGAITVTRLGTSFDRYQVRFPDFVDGSGMVLASAYGGNHTAVVSGWTSNGTDVTATVQTFDASGGSAPNAPFTISYRLRGGARNAYLWANNPSSASYTPATAFSWNGTRPDPTIVRVSAGNYLVTLPGLDAPFANGGHVQACTYGGFAARTKVQSWQVVGLDTQVQVRTYAMNGTAVDARFNLTYNEFAAPISDLDGGGAHVWAGQPSAPSYAPNPLFTDSKGREGPEGAERITRIGTGSYRVDLPDQAPSSSSVAHATGYGIDQTYATVTSWSDNGCGGTRVFVRTFDGAGNAADGRFLLSYVTNRPYQRRELAWAWVDPFGQGSTFTPSMSYQYNSSGIPVTVDRDPVQQNRFKVKFPGFGSAYGCVHASAYGGNHTAVVNGWSRVGTTIEAWIELFTPSGAPADNEAFTVRWRRIGNHAHREAYLFANSQNATNYTPNTLFSWNADRADPTITRTTPGIYTVRLPGLAQTAVGGHCQVTPYGPGMLRAKIGGWTPSGDDMLATVRVTNASGTLVNGVFLFSYCEGPAPIGVPFGSGAHVWASQPSTANYTPSPLYTASNGIAGPSGQEEITRISTGYYRVELPDQAPFDSSIAQVSAYGSTANYASLAGWTPGSNGGTSVFVRTYNPSGNPVDTLFNLLYMTDRPARPTADAGNLNYGSGCYGLTLQANTQPIACLDWELDVSGFPSGSLFGFLQLDLGQASTPLGGLAPGCSVLTGGAVTNVFFDLFSTRDYAFAVPGNPIFFGTELFAQGGAWVPGINAINVALSNGVRGTVGNN